MVTQTASVANSSLTSIGPDIPPMDHDRQHFAGIVRGVVQPEHRKRIVPLQRIGVAVVLQSSDAPPISQLPVLPVAQALVQGLQPRN